MFVLCVQKVVWKSEGQLSYLASGRTNNKFKTIFLFEKENEKQIIGLRITLSLFY